jgi:hypothetical protein
MIVCPVCEHQQAQGAACDNCGKVFGNVKPPPSAVAPMPELEGTHHGAAEIGQAQPVEGLEATRMRAGPDLPPMPVPELDRHQAPTDDFVPVLPMDELDLGRAPDDGVRTAAPVGAVTCRYCKAVQAEGAVCNKCGMRLPKVAAPAASTSARKAGAGESTRCRKCGAPAKTGAKCGDCGQPVPIPEA